MNPSLLRRIPALIRIGLAIIFIYAGIAKLMEARAFTASIVMMQIVPFRWAEWIAAILPLTELLTGLWLIVGWRRRAASLAAIFLGTVFAFAVGQAIIRNLDFNCHCFGISVNPPPAWLVFSRALLIVGSAAFLRWSACKAPCGTGQSMRGWE